MATKVELNHAGMAEMLKSAGVRAFVTSRAELVLAEAQSLSSEYEVTGNYHDSLHIEQATTDRAVARVVADVDYAMEVEARHGTLSRALDAAGGDVHKG